MTQTLRTEKFYPGRAAGRLHLRNSSVVAGFDEHLLDVGWSLRKRSAGRQLCSCRPSRVDHQRRIGKSLPAGATRQKSARSSTGAKVIDANPCLSKDFR